MSKKIKIDKWWAKQVMACYRCGCPISRNLPESHKRRATIDHILEISLGGKDSPKNWAACCFECNQNKGKILTKPKMIRWRLKYGSAEDFMCIVNNPSSKVKREIKKVFRRK